MANVDKPGSVKVFDVTKNARNSIEITHNGPGHIEIGDLKNKIEENKMTILSDARRIYSSYELKILYNLSAQPPDFPTPVEFRTSVLHHVTHKDAFLKIRESGEFKAMWSRTNGYTLSWWSLNIDEEHIKAAEERFLEKRFPDRTQEQIKSQETFLSKFTTSPAFSAFLGKSRYGNFRFTFPLNELMEAYKNQMCGGKDPVLREYKTTCFKNQIMYVVLIHSPEHNEEFKNFSEIQSSSVVDYKDGEIIWKAQAICTDFTHRLSVDENENKAKAEAFNETCYVWDYVAVAFHFSGALKFATEKVRNSISCCEADFNVPDDQKLSLKEANEILNSLS